MGLRGETAYIHLVDHYTSIDVASARISKGAPIEWVKRWLRQNIPDDLPEANRYVMLDQGGELANNPDFCKMIQSEPFFYHIEPIGAGAHHQHGVVERANRTVDTGIRSLLFGANLPIKFWPFALMFYVRIKNAALPRRSDRSSCVP